MIALINTAAVFMVLGLLSMITMSAMKKDMREKEGNPMIEEELKENSSGTKEVAFIVAIGLIGIVWLNLSRAAEMDNLIKAFNANKSIYCSPNLLEGKQITVNKKDGWYLQDEEYFKNRELGYVIHIRRCGEKF